MVELQNSNNDLSYEILELNSICEEQQEKIEDLESTIETILNLLEKMAENCLLTINWFDGELRARLMVCKSFDEAMQIKKRHLPAGHSVRFSSVLDIKNHYLCAISPSLNVSQQIMVDSVTEV